MPMSNTYPGLSNYIYFFLFFFSVNTGLYSFVFKTEVQVLTEPFKVKVTSMSLDMEGEELNSLFLKLCFLSIQVNSHLSEDLFP